MTTSSYRAWDDYFIPGTDTLRNKFTTAEAPYGEPDKNRLELLETLATHARMVELAEHPIEGAFDYEHLKAIHHHLFQDVYDWAGTEREVPVGEWMTKSGPDVVHYAPGDLRAPEVAYAYYPAGEPLASAAAQQFRQLESKDFLRGLDHGSFTVELAEIWGELNVVHPFREGNTRTQFVFFAQLAENAGYRLDAGAFVPGAPLRDEFVWARFYSQATGSNDRLAEVLLKGTTAITPAPLDPELQKMRDLARLSFPKTPAWNKPAGHEISDSGPAPESRSTERGLEGPGQGRTR
ncbi:Fic/DOC family protein [Arthrobacter woluwensis]|uniref:protein adenylyltransferase n=1 Tax=Arthrobacter woluwensis TaxID=156980 RepID=A0A1H4I6K9_9MICC|nr:Fic family protein [Arthrobacter woluwensis]SEB29707.1 cell filamentation protein [Arthrobacter woluwensis]